MPGLAIEDRREASTDTVVIVYGIDNRFALPMAASVASALEHLAPDRRLEVCVIDGGVSGRNRSRVVRSFEGRPCSFRWIKPPHRRLLALVVGGDVTVATYYRVLIPELLPPSYHKAIYLDADVIVQADLGKLWDTPFGGRHLLAVQDQGIWLISGPFGLKSYKSLGIPEDAKFFNTGVLVLDLDKWRQDRIAEKIFDRVRHHPFDGIGHDQDGVNAVLWNDWTELDPRWNQMPQLLQLKVAEESRFDRDTFHRVLEDPYIIHYAYASAKPWRFGCKHPATSKFFVYLDKTAYRGFRPTQWHTRLDLWRHFIRSRFRKVRNRVAVLWTAPRPGA